MLSSQQQKILSYFSDALQRDVLRHAYIIEGEKGMGKKYLCDCLQMYFACHTMSACRQCNGCKSAEARANPDIIRVCNAQENKNYEVGFVRELIKKIYEKPVSCAHKLIIIENAHMLGDICQNALLKAIEEPPPYAVFILVCDNLNTILPTVLSRVMTLKLRMWTENELRSCVSLRPEDDFMYGYAMGNIGTLIKISTDEDFGQIRKNAIDTICSFVKSTDFGVYDTTDMWIKNKDRIHDIINVTSLFLRDVIFFKNGQSELIVNKDKIGNIKAFADSVSKRSCFTMTEAVNNITAKISGYENLTMAIQNLFMELRNIKKTGG